MLPRCPSSLCALLLAFFATAAFADEKLELAAVDERLYVERCAMCHQVTGLGVPPVYPPLAGSNWFAANRERSIRVLCEGLSGHIAVNGVGYDNAMPAQVLDDAQTAAVLTYVGSAWGNRLPPFTEAEVASARATSRFKTFEELVKATAYPPLPTAPTGWTVREVAQLPEFCTRFAGNGKGAGVYVLAQSGGVYHLDPASGALLPVLKAADYLGPKSGDFVALGATQDAEGRLWIVTNQRLGGENPIQNEVVIFRTTEMVDGHPAKPQPWFRTRYPYGVGPYNHGVSNLAFGPDRMLYVNSGSRTDGGEPGGDTRFFQGGEVDLTACLWRLDPHAAEPKIEVIARGIRNAYGFAWDGRGQLFTASNGPDADAPEEMDAIVPGQHYGFPFQFADWPAREGSPYPHTPRAPEGVAFSKPVANLGPAGGGKRGGLFTFDPHSSPAGMIWCGDDFPAPLRGSFLVTRFGNLLTCAEDVGFDVLSVKPEQAPDHTWSAQVTTVLAPLGRPIDVIRSGPGRALILEYTRPTSFKDKLGWLPGRVLELAPTSAK